MKNIWLISPYIAVEKRSTRQAIIARYLEKLGYRCVLITTSTDLRYFRNNSPVAFIKKNHTRYMLVRQEVASFGGAKRVFAQLKFQQYAFKYSKAIGRPDLVIGNFAGPFGDVVFKFKKKYGTSVILDILDFWPEVLVELGHLNKDSPITKALYALEHRSYHQADSIFSSIVGFRDYITDKRWDIGVNSVDLSKIHYINNGIEIDEVDKDKEKWIIDDPDLDRTDVFKVGYIGSIGVPNHIDMVVEAAQKAQDKGMKILFLIYGDGGQLKKVKELSDEYNLHNIQFKGFLDKKYFPSTISRCNVALLNFENTPTLKYGMSNNKFFMYCASGIPILSTVRPGHSIVESHKCGIIVNNSPEGLIDGIKQFMNMDSKVYEQYKQNARAVGEEYDYNKMLGALKNEIVKLIGE
jgi:glycosyltransferase involved in cell wall biosynthesis